MGVGVVMSFMVWLVAVAAAGEGGVRFARPEPTVDLAAAAEDLRLQAIERLKGLLRGGPTGDARAEMLVRLASLTSDEARVLRLRELDAGGEPSADGSLAWLSSAIRLYEVVVREHPRFARWDEATFALAGALEEAGRTGEADEALVTLVRSRPDSPWLAEAWLVLGQHALDGGDANRALVAFQRSSAWPEAEHAAYALYGLAWARYNVGDLDGGIEALRRVIAHARDLPADDTATLRMDQEAISDLTRFYADAERVDEGIEVLTALGRPDLAQAALERLASTLGEQGRRTEAIRVYRRLLLQEPSAPEAERWALAITAALVADNRGEEALAELERVLAAGGRSSEVEVLLRRQALAWHDAARQHRRGKAKDADALYALADRAYAAWLGAFPGAPERTEVRFGAAELAWELGRAREAHDSYVAVVDAEPAGPRARFCAEGAVFASERLVGPIERPEASRAEPLPLTADEEVLLADYARLAAFDAHAEEASYKAAYLQYHRFRFDEAAELFRRVIALDPRSQDAELAAHLILDALALNERWEALASTAEAFATTSGLGGPSFRGEIRRIAVNASFQSIVAAFEREHDAAAAGLAFEAFAARWPEDPLTGVALHDAALRHAEAGRYADALRLRGRLVDEPRFRDAPNRLEDLRLLGHGLEQIADFEGAALRYEELAALSDDALAREALWSAAVFRHALGERERALADYRGFADRATDDLRRFDAMLRQGRLSAELGREGEAARLLAGLAQAPGVPGEVAASAALEAGAALGELGRGSERDHLYEAALLATPTGPAAAGMRLVLARSALDAYRALPVAGDDDVTLGRTAAAKTRALARVEVNLHAVVEAGDAAAGLRALDLLGDAWHEMAVALREAPVPERLTPEQAEVYRYGVSDRAYVLDQKAVDAWSLVVSRSAELSLHGATAARVLRKLAEQRPEEFGGLPELLPERTWASTAASSFAYETSL